MPGADARHGDGSRQRDPTAIVAWHVGLVVAVVLVVYANALPDAFLWDDLFLVVGNPAIKRWDALPRLFTSEIFPGGIASGYYRPLQALTYAPDSATTHSNLGNLYFRRDEIARARDAYLAAVRLDP
jgi:hypothetical protein